MYFLRCSNCDIDHKLVVYLYITIGLKPPEYNKYPNGIIGKHFAYMERVKFYLDASQADIKQHLAHDATVSKLWNYIVDGNEFSFGGNVGTVMRAHLGESLLGSLGGPCGIILGIIEGVIWGVALVLC